MKVSGIHIHNDSHDDDNTIHGSTVSTNSSSICRLAMLNEGGLPKEHNTTIQDAALRGVEMLRHLPVPVAQFDKEGQTMCENPESSKVFGATSSSSTDTPPPPTCTRCSKNDSSGGDTHNDQNNNNNKDTSSCCSSSSGTDTTTASMTTSSSSSDAITMIVT
jgi:hypothetical protein